MSAPTPRRWLRSARLAGVLRHPLPGLMIAVAVIGTMWALLVPPWQSPDEVWHFAYAQSLGERLALPGSQARAPFSTAESVAIADY